MAFLKWDAFKLGFTVLKAVRLTNNNLANKILIFHLVNTALFAEVFLLTMVNLFRVETEDFVDAMEGAISIFHVSKEFPPIVSHQKIIIIVSIGLDEVYLGDVLSRKFIENPGRCLQLLGLQIVFGKS